MCHTTRFHCHQTIEQHFAFWNTDKYEALTQYIWNHYKEATETICTLSSELAILKPTLRLSDKDFLHFLSDKFTYLNSVQQPPQHEEVSIQYVQVLDELEEQRAEWTTAREAANRALDGVAVGDFCTAMAALTNAWIQVELAFAKLQNMEALAAHLQGQLKLELPWIIGSKEYNLYKAEAVLGQHRQALSDLEHLVVM
ncbi:hypothetical protein JVT61DRAFT_14421 [Boletus reticuloceps]|uniref:Uncharacterized protein n=1 Tax=Boletus reticuloceps TaxID=495285 RepID=A0A8I3AA80_9AGAM|nr:hypothetical protein JVT61DRAFT_14421 [Boletus reticuloceps]